MVDKTSVGLLSLRPFYRSRSNTRLNRCLNLLDSPSFLILGDKTPSSVMLPHYEDSSNLLLYRLHELKVLHLRMMALLSSALTRIGMLALLAIWALSSVILSNSTAQTCGRGFLPLVWFHNNNSSRISLNEFTGADGAFFAQSSKCIRNLPFGDQMTVLEACPSWKRSVDLSLPISIPFVPSSSTGILRRCVNIN